MSTASEMAKDLRATNALLTRIGEALRTGETGEDLIEVARAAARGEMSDARGRALLLTVLEEASMDAGLRDEITRYLES